MYMLSLSLAIENQIKWNYLNVHHFVLQNRDKVYICQTLLLYNYVSMLPEETILILW